LLRLQFLLDLAGLGPVFFASLISPLVKVLESLQCGDESLFAAAFPRDETLTVASAIPA